MAPTGKAKLPILEGRARGRLRYVTADSSAVSDIPESTHASESAEPKDKYTAFHLGCGLRIVVRKRKEEVNKAAG